MNQKSKTIQKCQISGSKDLKTIFSLGYLPPVNKLNKINSLLDGFENLSIENFEEGSFPRKLFFVQNMKK